MKNTGFLFLAFATLAFSACMNNNGKTVKADITRDTLTYTYQEVKERAADCGHKPDNGCNVISIKYPFFQKNNLLNKAIKAGIANQYPYKDSTNTTIRQIIHNVLIHKKASYLTFMGKRVNALSSQNSSTDIKVLRQDSNLVTLQMNSNIREEANPRIDNFTLFFNWNTKTNHKITLEDIFNSDYKRELTTIAEKIFRKEENLKDTSSLARDYFFKDAKFALNDNFLITPTGIRFLYNTNEIKPAAAGTTDLFIPYSQIATLLKPNTVLAQYIKKQ